MPSYSKDKRRGVLAQFTRSDLNTRPGGRRTQVGTNIPRGVVPTKPVGAGAGRPGVPDALQTSASPRLPGPGQARKNVPIGNLSDFKKGPIEVGGKTVGEKGFFNATHKHGEPMKNMLAKLKSRRNTKGNAQKYTAA